MKKLFSIIFTFCICCNIIGQNTDFVIIKDTIHIDIGEGKLCQSLIVDGKYYCFFDRELPAFTEKKMYIISSDGKIEHCIDDLPNEVKSYYFDLHLRGDDIVIKTYYDKSSYIFNRETLKWEQINILDDCIYEDDKYYVTSLDFGEWGGATWFKDKTTGEEYRLGVVTPVVNKLNDKYYLTLPERVLEVSSPHDMHKCIPEERYQYTIDNKKYHDELYYSQGAKIIYRDPKYSYFEYLEKKCPTYIKTSFIQNNKLYHLLVKDCNAYLAEVNNGDLAELKLIGKNITIYNVHNTYRYPIHKDGSQIFLINDKINKHRGLLHIKGDTIALHYIDNAFKEKLKPKGKEETYAIFRQRFENAINLYGDQNIKDVITFEKQKNRAVVKSSYYKMNDPHTHESFYFVEDSVFTHEVQYFYSYNTNMVGRTYFMWKDYEPFRKPKDKNHVINLYINRFEELKQYITQFLTGENILAEQEDLKIYDVKWKTTTGLTIRLSANGEDFNFSQEIRLFLQK